jgi:hypothetical protein
MIFFFFFLRDILKEKITDLLKNKKIFDFLKNKTIGKSFHFSISGENKIKPHKQKKKKERKTLIHFFINDEEKKINFKSTKKNLFLG